MCLYIFAYIEVFTLLDFGSSLSSRLEEEEKKHLASLNIFLT